MKSTYGKLTPNTFDSLYKSSKEYLKDFFCLICTYSVYNQGFVMIIFIRQNEPELKKVINTMRSYDMDINSADYLISWLYNNIISE